MDFNLHGCNFQFINNFREREREIHRDRRENFDICILPTRDIYLFCPSILVPEIFTLSVNSFLFSRYTPFQFISHSVLLI